jgi:hypothetical protein
MRDISADANASKDLEELGARLGVQPIGVPAFYLRDQLIIGFLNGETTGKIIESLLDRPPSTSERDAITGDEPPVTIEVPLLGRLDLRQLGLPLFTIILGVLDGFNPCAMWVLLFLLSMLINLRDRRKMFLIGGLFIGVSGVVYFAFMAAWLNLFLLIGLSPWIQLLLGIVAAMIGALNIKDYSWLGSGPSVGIPEAAKPQIYRQVRRILQAENLIGALAGVAVLAAMVNTVELLCTAGLPALYTRVLTLHSLPAWAYYAYLALYNLAYIADDSLMLTIAVMTLSRHKLQETGARRLKLISGVVMLALGLALVFKPQWLSN